MNIRTLIRNPAVAAAFGLCALTALTDAFAYRMIFNWSTGRQTSGWAVPCNFFLGFVHWGQANIPWYLNPNGQGSNKASAISSALQSWTDVSGAPHTLTYSGTTSAGWATDGLNVASWGTGNGCSGNCLALTALVLQSGQLIVETDVTFNSGYSWSTSGADFDTEAVAVHEFGHALGFHHTEISSGDLPTMYAAYFGTAGRSLESDDESALQCSQSRYPL